MSTQAKLIAAAVVAVVAVVAAVMTFSGSDDGNGEAVPASGGDTTQATTSSSSSSSTSQATTSSAAPDPDRQPTAQEVLNSQLLLPWNVEATKTATKVPPPDPIQPIAVGTMYPIRLEVEGACENTQAECTDISSQPHFSMFGWTATEPIEDFVWVADASGWTITMTGYFLSAMYGDAATCVYKWTEEWDVEPTSAVLDGNVWYATAFNGTMTRSEEFDVAHSSGDIQNYCPGYASVDEWSVSAERNL